MNKHLLFAILLAALTQLSFAQQDSVERQIEQTLEQLLKLKDMPLLEGKSDPSAGASSSEASEPIIFDENWLINTVKSSSNYKSFQPVYESFVHYEKLMQRLSHLVKQVELEELITAQENPSAELLLAIAQDRVNNWEYYREIYEFYSQPKWQYRGIPKSSKEKKIGLQKGSFHYLCG